ncbi:adenosylcobalamin-dependent ribonucleoside-diphosphate reductase [Candidatus Uhrbacteria bacterium]|nr:adenosylcobalamin-dependent ribonucleoside-diphosphate reductase [Candidatus Uhrbacteria bacterium]
MMAKIRKRDGRIVPFDKAKIADAVFKAAQSVGGNDRKLAEGLADKVVAKLDQQCADGHIPNIEEVQDLVEKVLIEEGHAKTAKAYILYRQQRSQIREEVTRLLGGKQTALHKKLSLNALKIIAGRYLARDESGQIMETPEQMFDRVARTLAEVERRYGKNDNEVRKLRQEFYDIITSLEFLPAGRTLANAGAPTRVVANSIVLHMEDSMDGIFQTLKEASMLQQAGSGLGFPFHLLRPAGTIAKKSRGVASGPVSFLRVYDKAFGVIKQQGRHGANMAVMRVDHPDILEFIHCKAREGEIRNFNISVAVTNDFMQRVLDDDQQPWTCEWNGAEIKPRRIERDAYDTIISVKDETITPRQLMEEIVYAAWRNGEPGIIMIDNVNETNPLPDVGRIEACNPCGEQMLHDGDVCNLGSINLEKFVAGGRINWDRLRYVTRHAVRMLDNVIDITDFPVERVGITMRANRRVGLGIMGFADMLLKLRIPYNSEQGFETAEKVMSFINTAAHEMSQELAGEKGSFPNWHKSVYARKGIKMRNTALTSIAPTGTISMLSDVSSGIEPYFALVYQKSQVMGGQSMFYVNSIFEQELKDRGLYSEELMERIAKEGSVQDIPGIPDDVKAVFVTSMDIAPEGHVRIQAAFQKHTDNSISKTCNFPNTATKDDVLRTYLLAWQLGCKSLTVYRSGSRESEVLHLIKEPKKDEQKIAVLATTEGATHSSAVKMCPHCDVQLTAKEGCFECSQCGYGLCES